MAKEIRYKVWVEIERIETDEDGDETYHDEDSTIDALPRGIAYRDTLDDAIELAEEMESTFGEIPKLNQPIVISPDTV